MRNALLALSFLALSACVSSSEDAADAATDVGVDAAADVGVDAAWCAGDPGVSPDDPSSTCALQPDDPSLTCPAYVPRLFRCTALVDLACCINPGIAGPPDGPFPRCCL